MYTLHTLTCDGRIIFCERNNAIYTENNTIVDVTVDLNAEMATQCDFLIVNNINVIQHRFKLSRSTVDISAFKCGCFLKTHSFSVISENLATNHILLKTSFYELGP